MPDGPARCAAVSRRLQRRNRRPSRPRERPQDARFDRLRRRSRCRRSRARPHDGGVCACPLRRAPHRCVELRRRARQSPDRARDRAHGAPDREPRGSHRGRAETTPRASCRPASWCGNRTDARAVGRRLFVSKVFGLALGILAAIGGFVDIGDLVFNVSAGAMFGYELLWVIPVGVVGIIVFSEMCGRVAAVSKKAVFDAVRERVGFKAALGTLIASEVVNLMTFAAELGGVAIALQLLSGLPYRWLIVLAALGLGVMIWVTSFDWIERIFGYGGLCLLVFAVAAVKMSPDWGAVGHGFVPHMQTKSPLLYAYFAIGLLGAAMTPYEVYFYSSGGIEER